MTHRGLQLATFEHNSPLCQLLDMPESLRNPFDQVGCGESSCDARRSLQV